MKLVFNNFHPFSAERNAACVGTGNSTLILSCSTDGGRVIRVRDAFWGAHNDDSLSACNALDGDCKQSIDFRHVFKTCSGYKGCEIIQKSKETVQCTAKPLVVTKYIQIDYDCVASKYLYLIKTICYIILN